MALLDTIRRGESLSIAFTLPQDYDTARINELEIVVGSKVYPHTIVNQLITVKLTSNDTSKLSGYQAITVMLDDTLLGVRKLEVGTINVSSTYSRYGSESTSLNDTIVVVLTITETIISVSSVLYDYFRCKSAYELAVEGGYTGTEEEFNEDLATFRFWSEQAELAAQQAAADAIQTALDRIATGEDRVQTGQDVQTTAGNVIQTGFDVQTTAQAVIDAEAARDKAEQWAENPEDVPVEQDPDKFSALHWAAKAEETADSLTAALDKITELSPIFWDEDNQTFSFPVDDGGVIQINQEPHDYYFNLSGAPIVNGDIVSIFGATGNRTAMKLTDATDDALALACFGMVTVETIGANQVGRVTKSGGKVRGLNTIDYAEGSILYVNPANPGKWTATKPDAPVRSIEVGIVSVSHGTQGVVELFIKVYPKLNDLSDVDGTVNTIVDVDEMPVKQSIGSLIKFLSFANLKTVLAGVFESLTNKKQTVTNSATDYPSGAAVTTALATKQNTIGYTPENEANKRTTFQAAPTNTAYPSEKLVKDSLDLKADKSTVTQKIYLMLYEVATVVTGVITAVKKLWTEYSDRVTADSGTTTSLTNTERIYKMMVDNGMFNYLQFGWAADGGYKPRTSGILTFFTKIYNFFGTSDAVQATALNQPYRFFDGGMLHQTDQMHVNKTNIIYSTGQAWSYSFCINLHGYLSTDADRIVRIIRNDVSGRSQFRTQGQQFIFINESENVTTLQVSAHAFLGKRTRITLVADGLGNLSMYVNGVLRESKAATGGTAVTLNQILISGWGGLNYYRAIYSTALTQTQITAEHNLLSTLYPEIPSVTIGSQTWQLYNNEMVATPMGNVIGNTTLNSNIERIINIADRQFSSDTGFWTRSAGATISGGVCTLTGALQFINAISLLTAGRWYRLRYDVVSNNSATLSVDAANATITSTVGVNRVFYFMASQSYLNFLTGAGSVSIALDNVSVEEVGWADAQNIYNAVFAQTSGTTAQKTTAALREAAMWSYYNNDGAVGSWAGKLYNWYAVALMQEDITAYNTANPSTPWGWRGTLDADWVGLESDELKLDGETYWAVGNTGTNETGFAALPAGYRNAKGEFIELYNKAIFWNTDSNPTAVEKAFGFSMRLIKA